MELFDYLVRTGKYLFLIKFYCGYKSEKTKEMVAHVIICVNTWDY